jgi:putative protease
MRAAVANGADAVYFGLSDFSARKRATNFGLEELPAVMDFLRGHNVRGYVAFNTLIFSDELPGAAKFVEAIASAGVDAVIVQDIGLARLIRRMAPTLAIHASTQMTQTDGDGIGLLKELGVSRVILARELSVAQIRQIAAQGDMELEVFVHGALCMSYSGQCLASESLMGRSANRGLCAQACRLPYELRGTRRGGPVSSSAGAERMEFEGTHGRDGSTPLAEIAHATYLLSPRDLGAWDLVKDLVDVPVAGLKIEGRLKSPHYVAAATSIYRQALDAALAGRRFEISAAQMAQLEMSFSRGFTRGFLGGERGSLVDGRFGNSRGQFLGTVVGKAGSGIVIELDGRECGTGDFGERSRAVPPVGSSAYRGRMQAEETHGRDAHATSRRDALAIKPGDGLVFDDGSDQDKPPGGRVYRARPVPGQAAPTGRSRVEVVFGRDDLDAGAVAIGNAVWKTDDPALRAELEKTWARDVVVHRAPLYARVMAAVGQPLRLEMWERGMAVPAMSSSAGSSRMEFEETHGRDGSAPLAEIAHATRTHASVQSAQPMEASRQHPLMVDLLRKQLGRLGGTPFELAEIELQDIDGQACESAPVMAPASVLNDLRRRAVELLLARHKAAAIHAVVAGDALETLRREAAMAETPISQAAGMRDGGSDVASKGCLHVLVRNLEQLEAVLAWRRGDGCDTGLIYCDFDNVGQYAAAVEAGRAAGAAIGIASPRIVKPGEHEVLAAIARLSPAAVLVRNLGSMAWLGEHCPQLPLVCDFSLNAANELSAKWLAMRRALRITPSYDLNMQQFAAMAGRCMPAVLEAVVHFHMPMFHIEHCILGVAVGVGHAAVSGTGVPPVSSPVGPAHMVCEETHGRDAHATKCHATAFLRDRMGMEHAVLRDCMCRNTVYNAHAQSAAFFVGQIQKLGVRHFRVELLTHAPQEIGPLLDVYSQLIAGRIEGRDAWREVQSLNPNGLTRGTWELA